MAVNVTVQLMVGRPVDLVNAGALHERITDGDSVGQRGRMKQRRTDATAVGRPARKGSAVGPVLRKTFKLKIVSTWKRLDTKT